MKINTLYELLRHGVEKFASRTAFDMFNGESVTYAEVGRRAAAVQEALVGAGVKAGDKVALLSSSMPNWGICYLAGHLGRHGRGTDPSRLLRPRTGYDPRPFRGESPAGLGPNSFPNFRSRRSIRSISSSGPRIWGSSPSMSRQRDLRRFLRPTTWRRSSIRRERRRAPRA